MGTRVKNICGNSQCTQMPWVGERAENCPKCGDYLSYEEHSDYPTFKFSFGMKESDYVSNQVNIKPAQEPQTWIGKIQRIHLEFYANFNEYPNELIVSFHNENEIKTTIFPRNTNGIQLTVYGMILIRDRYCPDDSMTAMSSNTGNVLHKKV